MNAAAERELDRLVRDGILNALENLVRVGTVTWTDPDKRVARVKFRDTDIPSAPLHVLANRPYIPDYDTRPQRTEFEAGGSEAASFASHSHALAVKPWMPRVNAVVLCLYLPVWNGDGYILGEIGALGGLKQME